MLLEARSTSSVSPDGKQTVVNGVDFFRMQDGRQAEHWVDRTCSAS
jgi:predicted SnoaL-like aldol condensation-catalyzing enzyme